MDLIELDDPGPLSAPVLIVAFEGWVSAGSAGTATAEHIAGDGGVIARFQSDLLFDYRANRPTADYQEGVMSDLGWPEVSLRRRTVGDRDLLVLSGVEPNWNWQRLGREVAELAAQLGVYEHISLGGVPWAVPHTRPTSIIETASRSDLLQPDADHPHGLLRVPAAAVSAVEWAMVERGVPSYGFWARVPHYVGAVYTPAVVALTERVSSHLGVAIPFGSLVEDAGRQRALLDELVEQQEPAKELVRKLEQMADEAGTVSGEELAAEITRFLQERAPEDPFGDGSP